MRFLLSICLLFLLGCQAKESSTNIGESKLVGSASLIVDLERLPDEVVPVWPSDPPGGIPDGLAEHYVERDNRFGLPDRSHNEVTNPNLSIFKPKNPDGSALLIIPGGGYRWVVVEKEGWESARWYARCGVTVYVLSYRLPHQGWEAGPDTPLQDAQRSMRLIRARSEQDRINPNRIMSMGFSAGGHLAGALSTRFDDTVYGKIDEVDNYSARPDASVLIYPVITLTKPFTHESTSENMVGAGASIERQKLYSVENSPPENAPPVFILHATNDMSVPVENALMAYNAFRKAGVSAALHVFDSGGHGFGLRGIDDDPLRIWPEMVMNWGESKAIFTPNANN